MKEKILSIGLGFAMVIIIISAMIVPVDAAVRTIITTEFPYDQLQSLHAECEEVINFDENLENLIGDLKDTLKAEGEAATCLSAPQIGVNSRVCVIRDGNNIYEMVNPEITGTEGEIREATGCLSAPNVFRDIVYPEAITVKFYDGAGTEVRSTYSDFDAQVIMHAISHLDGTMINDNEDCTVTFNANGHGSAPASQNVTSYSLAKEPEAPAAEGWHFEGWYRDSGCTSAWNFASNAVTNDITLYAKWTSYFSYTETEDSVTITKYSGPENATVPSEINGKPVTVIGDSAFFGCRDLKKVSLPETITEISSNAFKNCYTLSDVQLSPNIKAIGDNAFYDCRNLSTISLPESLETMGEGVFSECSALTKVSLPDGITDIPANAFKNCYIMSDVEFSKNLKTIGDNAFWQCRGLTSLELPKGVKTIGKNAFYDCRGLSAISLSESLETMGEGAFNDCSHLTKVSLSDYITDIPANAFKNCYNMSNIEFPKNLKTIGEGAFINCSSFTKVSLPDGVTDIAANAFTSCSSLTDIELSKNLKTIGANAFNDCRNLTTISLPESLEKMGEGVFSGCSALTKVSFPDGITDIPANTFYRCHELTNIEFPKNLKTIGESAFNDCRGIKDLELPEGLKTIGRSAFEGCGHLSAIRLPESLETIRQCAFSGCSSLTKVSLPDGITDIPVKAFYKCYHLTNIELPKNLKRIGRSAFEGCIDLSDISWPDGLRTMGDKAFSSCTGLKSVELPDSVESIGGNCFESCFGLRLIDLPLELRTIGDEAFYDCRSVEELYFSPQVESVGDNAFYHNRQLTDVYIRDIRNYNDVVFGSGESKPTEREGVNVNIYTPYNLEDMVFENLDFTYDGTEHIITPGCDKIAKEDLSYNELRVTDSGTYELTVMGDRKKCYGKRTLKLHVDEKQIVEGDVTISGIKDCTYTGRALKQNLVIRLGETELVSGTDYKVNYDNNIKPGIAQMDIVFIGNYKGTITKAFKISPKKAVVSKATPGKKKLTVKMKTRVSLTGGAVYQIAYKQKGTSKWKYTTTTKQSKTISKLKKGKKYYVKVRAYKTVNSKNYYGAWSKTKLSKKIK